MVEKRIRGFYPRLKRLKKKGGEGEDPSFNGEEKKEEDQREKEMKGRKR